jgi:uncharacterized protein (DUF1800 family)
MTTEYSLTALTQILSAMDGQKRNPCTKKAAIKAINKNAETLGIAPGDVIGAADLLLGGVMTAEEWRDDLIAKEDARLEPEAEVQAEADAQIETEAEPVEPEAEEPVEPAQEDEPPMWLTSERFVETEFAKENEASWDKVAKKDRKPRESKQARMIEMLKRPEGATVEQIGEEMGWQKHTVRGAISGALRKKLGLNITSGKIDGKRTYRIED